jgi:hypothetical protein
MSLYESIGSRIFCTRFEFPGTIGDSKYIVIVVFELFIWFGILNKLISRDPVLRTAVKGMQNVECICGILIHSKPGIQTSKSYFG